MSVHDLRCYYISQSPLRRGATFYFGFFGVMGIFFPFINVYFRQELGFSGWQIGVLSILFPLSRVAIAVPAAALADRRRWRILILTWSIVGFGAMLSVAWVPHSFLVWMLVMTGIAVFFGPIVPLADSIIAQMALRHRLTYGTMRLWGSLSFAMMAISWGSVWERIGFGRMFPVAGIAFLVIGMLTSGLEEERSDAATVASGLPLKELRQDPGLVILIVVSFLVGAAINLSTVFDGIYMSALGGSRLLVGLMFGLSAFSELPTMQASGWCLRRVGGGRTLFAAYSVMLLAFCAYALAGHPWLLLLTAMLKGLGFGLFQTSTVQITSERAPRAWTSTIQTYVSMSAFGLAPLVAAPLGGQIFDRFGPEAVFWCASLLVAAALVILTLTIVKGIFTENVRESTVQNG